MTKTNPYPEGLEAGKSVHAVAAMAAAAGAATAAATAAARR